MLTSWSEQSTPAELSMESVLLRPPSLRQYSMRPLLGQAKVGAPSPMTLAFNSSPIDAHERRWRGRPLPDRSPHGWP